MCSSKLSLGWRTTRTAVRPRNATTGTRAPQAASLSRAGHPPDPPAPRSPDRSPAVPADRDQPSSGRKPRSASSRGSMSSSGWSWTPSSRGSPQTTHRPGQSGRSSGAIGSASWIASRTAVSRSSSWWSVSRATSGSSSVAIGRPLARSSDGRNSSWSRSSTGKTTSRRQRLHSRSSAVVRSAAARIPRLVRSRRTRPSIGVARRRSSPRSIVTAWISNVRSAPGSSPSRPATFHASGPSTGRARGHRVVGDGSASSSQD